MARCARSLSEGGYYHILTRGNDRKRIFRFNEDYQHFIHLVSEYLDEYPVNIYHYCLMGNHLHFLIGVIDQKKTVKFFQGLFQSYAAHFKKKYRHTGYVYQNRYKSIPVEKEAYLLDCARYIERNPVRAGIVKDPGDYRWSSYSYYARGLPRDIIRVPNPLYMALSDSPQQRQALYREYVKQDRPYELIVDKGLKVE